MSWPLIGLLAIGLCCVIGGMIRAALELLGGMDCDRL